MPVRRVSFRASALWLVQALLVSLLTVGLHGCDSGRQTEAQIKAAAAKDKIIALAESMPAPKGAGDVAAASAGQTAGQPSMAPSPPAPPPTGRKVSPPVRINHVRLFREPVEMYWNDWFGTLIRNDLGQAYVAIEGAGKTASFMGVISMNCRNGLYLWEGARDGPDNAVDDQGRLIRPKIVPEAVLAQVRYRYCPDAKPR